jgi:hypothetical protein
MIKAFGIFALSIIIMQIAKVLNIISLFIVSDFFVGLAAILLFMRECLKYNLYNLKFKIAITTSFILFILFILSQHLLLAFLLPFYIGLLAFIGFIMTLTAKNRKWFLIIMYGFYVLHNFIRGYFYTANLEMYPYLYIFVLMGLSIHLLILFRGDV